MAELDGAGDPERREAAHVLGREALRVLDPLAKSERRPLVARRLEGVERLAIRAVADRMDSDRPPDPRPRADDLGELLAARDHHARAVEHPGGLGAERPVHERLQVADAEEVAPDARVHPEGLELGDALVGDGLPDAEREPVALGDALEDARRAEPAVLVVDRDDASGRRGAEALARGVDELVLLRHRKARPELPGGLLAQDPGQLSALVPLDDPSSTWRSPSACASAAELSHAEW